GRWLAVNGEAIFGTRPWVRFGGFAGLGGVEVRYTRKGSALYAVLFGRPAGNVVGLPGVQAARGTSVTLLGGRGFLSWRQAGNTLAVALPPQLPSSEAYVLRIMR